MNRLRVIVFLLIPLIASCGKYARGDKFAANFEGDSLVYVVAAKGPGTKISEVAELMKYEHESRGNTCVITYLTDSAILNDKKGLLLLNAALPNIEDDLLSKGFFGQFTSKQIVSYLLVSYEDVNRFLIEKD